jgi:hypothetical protein
MYCTPGPDNSIRINTEKAVPIRPENKANIKYNTPMSFALLDNIQRSDHMDISDFISVCLSELLNSVSICFAKLSKLVIELILYVIKNTGEIAIVAHHIDLNREIPHVFTAV